MAMDVVSEVCTRRRMLAMIMTKFCSTFDVSIFMHI